MFNKVFRHSTRIIKITMDPEAAISNTEGKGSIVPPPDQRRLPSNPNDQDRHFWRHLTRAVVLFGMVTLTFVVFYRASESHVLHLLPQSFSFTLGNNPTSPGNGELGLKKILKRAAMRNKTVIITTLNDAWIEPDSIFDLFLESFRIGNQTLGLLKHLVVVALDQNALNHCLKLHLNCYILTTEGVDFSGEAHFMTGTYLQMMWRRIDFLRTVLEMGYNFVFTDADIMWLRSPFPHFYSDTNFQISCDGYVGNPSDLNNALNGGFNYVRSSNETVQFYKFWYRSRESYPGKHDQDVLNKIKYDPFIRQILGLEIKFLDTVYFGGFCSPSRDLNLVCTMHANCCAGLDNKIHDLKILLNDWRNYIALPEDMKKSQPPFWSIPQSCGLASFRHHTPRKSNGSEAK